MSAPHDSNAISMVHASLNTSGNSMLEQLDVPAEAVIIRRLGGRLGV
jgi:hypothetical protein